MGTSWTVRQRDRTMISRAILKPRALRPLVRARWNVAFSTQKKPDIGSVDLASGHASNVAPFEMTRRRSDHSKPTPPWSTLREPMANWASPRSTGATTAGTDSGSCCRSASMHASTSNLPSEKPSTTALLRPRPSPLRRTCMCTGYPSFSRNAFTTASLAAVPADSSSAKRSSTSSAAFRVAANNRRVSSAKFSVSLYVGTTIDTPGFG
mmetsp:Transcript_16202/g.49011  ORF Transcript_16202/g.49011 Transcript_16202/m.49011 type:complete len:209 (+) Transcript_16202:312-938(+)